MTKMFIAGTDCFTDVVLMILILLGVIPQVGATKFPATANLAPGNKYQIGRVDIKLS